MTDTPQPAAVIVLAAGQGTRMKSALPKVLHPLGGKPMVGHALTAARELEPGQVAVVVRHEREQVAAAVARLDPAAILVDQDQIPGTGRAVQCALAALDAKAQAASAAAGLADGELVGEGLDGAVVVVAGDVPLLDGATLGQLLSAHHADGNAVTVLTTEVDDATGYGRIVREKDTGDVLEIVEHKDASADQLEIREINSSVYVFDAATLRRGLGGLGSKNAQGEVYLTDVIAFARNEGLHVRALLADDPMLVEGVNDRVALSVLAREMNRRVVEEWQRAGVTVQDPATTWIDVDVELAPDVTLLPNTQLQGTTVVASGATIGPDTTLTDVEVGAGATVIRTHGSLAVIGEGASVGPFAYLRPGTRLGRKGKIGTFVETKNAEIGDGSKVPHLSYVGDATIGEHSNIGAASVTVNYDGVHKHRTVIGSHARTGADNMFVAPVSVGDGAYTAAGSVIRRDVPAGALGVTAGQQRNIEGWVARRRPGTAAADAAAGALGASSGLGDQAQRQLAQQNAAGAPAPRAAAAQAEADQVPAGGADTEGNTH
ncbi:bifunctional UDP-N-acetylglucosamine pyrophosphorylase / Glucosamine-1-phosphate N-acetyltransferase [Promicromonospora thailandica]|uniref:Bifunctional protein GlmU n=2 Tax=Promicromonospora thailandica TaxID=765201 RepID=A0A9X2G9R6_9MICO|nr:bifunctional UDP-N-acetylglucosamine diphosphorylase/glucosamine-1-phosphate N-acetyltransferase GlmU [Promicromonospora thailandica]MCP2264531.1 bifunctional UDP-N-acetylglucosamine pyrophosphorylase / Glucosamine-1-phosphate N-acetyltransferase [Promicromonospora thailandica]BFF20404.1 bifunctional UDP-N-acetylglucosamine diphosphorylase/glucosamine-1-phosphate N-acetyltransferase GlmU [Promicromonospora thailandica]